MLVIRRLPCVVAGFSSSPHHRGAMPLTRHVERHCTSVDTVRAIVIGMWDGLTVRLALAAGLPAPGAVWSTSIAITAGLAEIGGGSIAMGATSAILCSGKLRRRSNAARFEVSDHTTIGRSTLTLAGDPWLTCPTSDRCLYCLMRFEKVWIEQCRATRAIKRRFGARSALDYLIGEKLLAFADAAEDHPEFAAELPRFLSAIYRVFNQYEIAGYVASRKPKIRKTLKQLLLTH